MPSLTPVQRTAAYGVVRDREGRVLLVRASARSDLSGHWFLPGGGVRHGESPADAIRRELQEETGLVVPPSAIAPLDATADVIDLPFRGASLHTIRLIFSVTLDPADGDPALRPEPDGTSDLVEFLPLDDAARLPLMPFVASVLGLHAGADRAVRVCVPQRPEPLLDDVLAVGGATTGPDEGDVPGDPGPEDDAVVRVQRPAAYAVLVTGNPNGNGRMLLSKLSGSDLWTLPGGGIDHGEMPLAALEREVHEEAGLPYTPGPLLDISSRHFTGRAPSGRLEDFHGIRLLYGGSVPDDVEPQVLDVGGSSDDIAWFRVRELGQLTTVASVRQGLRMLRRTRALPPARRGRLG